MILAPVLLAGALAFATVPPAGLEAVFIGNMAFRLTDGTTVIYTDFPYESGYSGYMTYDFDAVTKSPGALCLVTHGHRDHFDARLFSKLDARLIAPPSVEALVPKDRIIPLAPRMRFGDVAIESFDTPHAGEHVSYLVTWNGLRLYFTGDTGSLDALLAAKGLDAAFVSPWLLGMAAEKKAKIDARRVIVYHHRKDETVVDWQDRVVPKQGETLTLRR